MKLSTKCKFISRAGPQFCYERPALNTNWLLFGSMLATKECKTSYFSNYLFSYTHILMLSVSMILINPIVQLIFTEHNSSILTMFRILRDFVFNEFGPLLFFDNSYFFYWYLDFFGFPITHCSH